MGKSMVTRTGLCIAALNTLFLLLGMAGIVFSLIGIRDAQILNRVLGEVSKCHFDILGNNEMVGVYILLYSALCFFLSATGCLASLFLLRKVLVCYALSLLILLATEMYYITYFTMTDANSKTFIERGMERMLLHYNESEENPPAGASIVKIYFGMGCLHAVNSLLEAHIDKLILFAVILACLLILLLYLTMRQCLSENLETALEQTHVRVLPGTTPDLGPALPDRPVPDGELKGASAFRVLSGNGDVVAKKSRSMSEITVIDEDFYSRTSRISSPSFSRYDLAPSRDNLHTLLGQYDDYSSTMARLQKQHYLAKPSSGKPRWIRTLVEDTRSSLMASKSGTASSFAGRSFTGEEKPAREFKVKDSESMTSSCYSDSDSFKSL